ncbi:MAG TPA: CHRD domain-containing protein [Devosiaceae bacterium]|nr:CHRD domain-containing protein [Devosiaceae bacterium]
MSALFRTAFIASALGLTFAAAPAFAATEKFSADLTAAAVGPTDTSTGTGTATISYNTTSKVLTWSITYKGLTGKATAAHFHGPAAAGTNAPPEVPLKGSLGSPIKGRATLTAKEAADLEAGMLYLNVHTAKYPDGEIRGQVAKAQ